MHISTSSPSPLITVQKLAGSACRILDLLGPEGTVLFLSPEISNPSSAVWMSRNWHSCSQASVTTHFPAATARKYLTLRMFTVLVPFSVPQTTCVIPSVYLASTVQPRLLFRGVDNGIVQRTTGMDRGVFIFCIP